MFKNKTLQMAYLGMRLLMLLYFGQIFGQTSAFREELGLVLSQEKIALPENINIEIYGLVLPDPFEQLNSVNENINQLSGIIKEGKMFNEDQNELMYPVHDLGQTMLHTIFEIQQSIKVMKGICSTRTIGANMDTKKSYKLELDDIIPVSSFKEAEYLISELSKNRNRVPDPSTSSTFRDSGNFQRILYVVSFLTKSLQNFNKDLKNYVDLMNDLLYGNVESLHNSILDNHLKSDFTSEYTIIDVPGFRKNSQNFRIWLEIATLSNVKELTKFKNVQYFNLKLSGTYYGDMETYKIFQMKCLNRHVCYPIVTPCTEAIENSTLLQIIGTCTFEPSYSEYEIVGERGILINENPSSASVKNLLETQNIDISTYPTLFTFTGCFKDELKYLNVCFRSSKKIIKSKYSSDSLYYYLHPIFFNRVVKYFIDFPLMISIVAAVLSILCTSSCFKCIRRRLRKSKSQSSSNKPNKPDKNKYQKVQRRK